MVIGCCHTGKWWGGSELRRWLTSLSWTAVPKTCPRMTTGAWCATRLCSKSGAACRPARRPNRCPRPRRTRTRARWRHRTWPTRTPSHWCPARRTWRRCPRRPTTRGAEDRPRTPEVTRWSATPWPSRPTRRQRPRLTTGGGYYEWRPLQWPRPPYKIASGTTTTTVTTVTTWPDGGAATMTLRTAVNARRSRSCWWSVAEVYDADRKRCCGRRWTAAYGGGLAAERSHGRWTRARRRTWRPTNCRCAFGRGCRRRSARRRGDPRMSGARERARVLAVLPPSWR